MTARPAVALYDLRFRTAAPFRRRNPIQGSSA
jgi:hypothetical protein